METGSFNNEIVTGVIWKQLLKFFFPILFGTFFQMLYNTVDAIIVGQALGKAALAAVGGGTGTFINLIIGFFSGLAAGTGVVISQKYGAQDRKQIDDAVHTTLALAIVSSIAITIIGLLSSKAVLIAIDTPEDILPLALDYLNIFFAGVFTLVFFNIGTGIFRSIGDSRHPLYFLIIGMISNIALDVLFVIIIPLGVRGAALATVLSQGVSMLITFIFLKKGKTASTSISGKSGSAPTCSTPC
jgi:Na+-driven multidrug efflux pump